MPYTTVVAGTVITASWGNMVRDQLVTPFADAATRNAQVTAPVEGIYAYLSDINELTFWDGAAWDRNEEYKFVGRALQTASIISTNAGGHVETFTATAMITATLVAGSTYKAHYEGAASGTAGDRGVMRLRYKAGATVDAAGTVLDGGLKTTSIGSTASYISVSVGGTFVAPSSAQYTVGVSMDWSSGGANDITLYYVAGEVTPILTLERVKRA